MGRIVDLKKFGPIISDKDNGLKVYELIKSIIVEDGNVEVDLKEILSMATFCAKQIFGKLYIDMGAQSFFENVKLLNVNDDMKLIINMGIHSALNDKKENN